MAFVHGKGAVVTLDGDALTAFTNSITVSREADSHEVTAFGATAKAYQAGLEDATVTLEGIYDDGGTSPSEVIRPLLGAAAVTLIVQPEGAGSGNPQYSVSVIPTSYEESIPVGDMISWSAELQCTGVITESTL